MVAPRDTRLGRATTIALAVAIAASLAGCCLEGSEHGQDPSRCQGDDHLALIQYRPLGLMPGAVLVSVDDDGQRGWQALPLAADGAPLGELAPTAVSSDAPRVSIWPGTDGALITAAGADVEVLLEDRAGLRSITHLPGSTLTATFDGASYWLVDQARAATDPFVLTAVDPDGRVRRTTVPTPLTPADASAQLQLAAATPGEVLVVWGWYPQQRPEALTLRAMRYVDGQPVGAPWTIAAPIGATCLAAERALVATADGYHLITRRGPCDASQPPRMIDIQIDAVAATATERAMAFDPGDFPTGWVADPRGLLAYDADHAWSIAADGTAQLLWSAGDREYLVSAGLTSAGFAGVVVRAGPAIDLVWGAPPAPQRAFVASDFTYPDGGCQVGRSPTPLLAVVAWLALGRRRRR